MPDVQAGRNRGPRGQAFVSAGPRLLTCRQAAELLAVSRASLWRMSAAGRIPGPVYLGGPPGTDGRRRGCPRWRADELARWIERGCPRSRP